MAARALGSGRFVFAQTLAIAAWVVLNLLVARLAWDRFPFYALNLAFSLQSAYAAPLVLLAASRQAAGDRDRAESDRRRQLLVSAEIDFLTREVVDARLAVHQAVSATDLRDTLAGIERRLAAVVERIDAA